MPSLTARDLRQACPPPLYPKLRPGRHTIPVDEIEAIQCERLRGAVIHAVASGGYQATSTRELCRLAGVSKRTLYERFGSKEACLQAAYDAILEAIVMAMRHAHASRREPQARLHAMIAAFQTAILPERGAALALLVTAEAAESDAKGPMRLVDHVAGQLRACYEDGDGPPDFVIRGAATAVMSVSRSWIYHGREDELGELAQQLSDWMHRYRDKTTRLLGRERSEPLTKAVVARERHGVDAEGEPTAGAPHSLQQSSERALKLMAKKGASGRDWAVGLCLAYRELFEHLRGDPHSARLAFVDAPGLGPDADGVREQMIQAAVDLYTKRAPATRTPSPAVAHAVVGASWGLLHDHLECRDHDLRPTILCEQMAYLAIAPVLGPGRAVRSILAQGSVTRSPRAPAGRGRAGIRTGAGASMATW